MTAFHHMAVVQDGLHRVGEPLGDSAAGEKGRLDVLFAQDPQQPIYCVVGTVFALTPHFVIQNAVLIRLDVLAALEVEGQKDGGPLPTRPADEMVIVVFLEHDVSIAVGANVSYPLAQVDNSS